MDLEKDKLWVSHVTSEEDFIFQAAARGELRQLHRTYPPGRKLTPWPRFWRNSSVLHVAAAAENAFVVRWLVEAHGLDVNTRNRNGSTVVMVACELKLNELCSFLAQRGANLDAQDVEGNTALIRGIKRNNGTAAEVMTVLGADTTLTNSNGQDAVQAALKAGNAASAAFLAGSGAVLVTNFSPPKVQNLRNSGKVVLDCVFYFTDMVSDALVTIALWEAGEVEFFGFQLVFMLLPSIIMFLVPHQTLFERFVTALQLRFVYENLVALPEEYFSVRWGTMQMLHAIFEDLPSLFFQLYLVLAVDSALDSSDPTLMLSIVIGIINVARTTREMYLEARGGPWFRDVVYSALSIVTRIIMWLFMVVLAAREGLVAAVLLLGPLWVIVLRYRVAQVHDMNVVVTDLLNSVVFDAALINNPHAFFAVSVLSLCEVLLFFVGPATIISTGLTSVPADFLPGVNLILLAFVTLAMLLVYAVLACVVGMTSLKKARALAAERQDLTQAAVQVAETANGQDIQDTAGDGVDVSDLAGVRKLNKAAQAVSRANVAVDKAVGKSFIWGLSPIQYLLVPLAIPPLLLGAAQLLVSVVVSIANSCPRRRDRTQPPTAAVFDVAAGGETATPNADPRAGDEVLHKAMRAAEDAELAEERADAESSHEEIIEAEEAEEDDVDDDDVEVATAVDVDVKREDGGENDGDDGAGGDKNHDADSLRDAQGRATFSREHTNVYSLFGVLVLTLFLVCFVIVDLVCIADPTFANQCSQLPPGGGGDIFIIIAAYLLYLRLVFNHPMAAVIGAMKTAEEGFHLHCKIPKMRPNMLFWGEAYRMVTRVEHYTDENGRWKTREYTEKVVDYTASEYWEYDDHVDVLEPFPEEAEGLFIVTYATTHGMAGPDIRAEYEKDWARFQAQVERRRRRGGYVDTSSTYECDVDAIGVQMLVDEASAPRLLRYTFFVYASVLLGGFPFLLWASGLATPYTIGSIKRFIKEPRVVVVPDKKQKKKKKMFFW